MGQLDQQVAVISGAATGVGRAIAEAFAAQGARIVLAGRRETELQSAAESIRAAGGTAIAAPTDVTVETQVVALFRQACDEFGRVDLLVNSAGVSTRVPTEDLPLADWRRVIDVNLTGAFLCSREALRVMKRQRRGRIINIGSISAQAPRPHAAAYVASKFGLDGLTRSMALDGREHGISVCIVHPGNVATPIWHGREDVAQNEGVMAAGDVARLVLTIAAMPPHVNVLETTVLPVTQPFLGRG